MKRIILGLIEPVIINGKAKSEKLMARIDSGATKSSIDEKMVQQLRLGPVKRTKVVKSAHGARLRPIIEATITLSRKKITAEFTVADRSNMRYKLLIGQNILKEGKYLIDPLKELK